MRNYLIIFLECTAIFVFLAFFGFNVLAIRIIYYIPIPGSIFGAIGICEAKRIFPKIWIKKPKIQKVIEAYLISILFVSSILGLTYVRNAFALQEEIDAMDWFKTRDDYEKLINKDTSDIQIICNNHLRKWIKYRVHYNALVYKDEIKCLNDLKVANLEEKAYREDLRDKAKEKLYIFISKNNEPFGEYENWTIKGLNEFFNEYRKYYNFTWNEYTINELVLIWEIEYI